MRIIRTLLLAGLCLVSYRVAILSGNMHSVASLRAQVNPAPTPVDASNSLTFFDVYYASFTPSVVDVSVDEPITFTMVTDTQVTRADIALSGGSTVPLSAPTCTNSRCTFTATLTHAQALYNYGPYKVSHIPTGTFVGPDQDNHNFVGFLETYHADAAGHETKLGQLNLFINVSDSQIPPVNITPIASDMQASPYVVNLSIPLSSLPDQTPADIDLRASVLQMVTRRFYQVYPDDFDFLAVVSTPDVFENRYHAHVRNDVQGIGLPTFDYSALYSSSGQLHAIIRYPIPYYFDLAETATSHEIGHQWLQYLDLPATRASIPHWPLGTLAQSLMGFSIPSTNEGGEFPYELTALGNGDYRVKSGPGARAFTDMDLYLMGLMPASGVGTHSVFTDQTLNSLCEGCIVHSAPFTVQDVINRYGPRLPAYPDAQTHFRLATIVVSIGGLLSAREMAFYDYFAARGEAGTPLSFSAGFEGGTTLPFSLATGGRATLRTALQLTTPPFVPAATPTPMPTVTPLPTPTPSPTPTSSQVPLTARVTMKHKTVTVGQKQMVTVATVSGASVTITVLYPDGKKLKHHAVADSDGHVSWSFKHAVTVARVRTGIVRITVVVTDGNGASLRVRKTYTVR